MSAETNRLQSGSGKGQLKELNWLRGLAALFVVLYHFTTRYQEAFGHKGDWNVEFSWGCGAVNVFFILSCFLTALTLKEDASMSDYLKKRFIRLYPAYWVCLILTTVVTGLLLPQRFAGIPATLVNFTMLQSFIGVAPADGAYWTLMYELQFYVYIAAIILLRKVKWLKYFAFFGTAASAVLLLGTSFVGTNTVFSLLRFVLLGDYGISFFGGIFLCMLKKNKKDIISLIGLLGAVVQAYFLHTRTYFVFYLVTVAVIAVVIIMNSCNCSRYNTVVDYLDRTWLKVLSFIAKISFPLYLLHQNIGMAIIYHLEKHGFVSEWFIFVPIAVAIVLAWLVHRFVEKPVLKWSTAKKASLSV